LERDELTLKKKVSGHFEGKKDFIEETRKC
jgi:hypothetical protein